MSLGFKATWDKGGYYGMEVVSHRGWWQSDIVIWERFLPLVRASPATLTTHVYSGSRRSSPHFLEERATAAAAPVASPSVCRSGGSCFHPLLTWRSSPTIRMLNIHVTKRFCGGIFVIWATSEDKTGTVPDGRWKVFRFKILDSSCKPQNSPTIH